MSTFDRLASLTVQVDACDFEPLECRVASGFVRVATQVKLAGGGEQGVGEDVTYSAADQRALLELDTRPLRTAGGPIELAAWSERLARTELFPAPPQQPASRDYRRWAFESAALDLALRQAGQGLAERLELCPRPVRFVISTGLGTPPGTASLRRWLEHDPGARFKLDASPLWTDELIAELAALDAVDVVDLKGHYAGTPVDQRPDPALYRRVAEGLPSAWLEDPWLDERTAVALEAHHARITWDAPIHGVDDVRALAFAPRRLNVKPSRSGSLRRLLDLYDHCAAQGIACYGGGQFELGAGRAQIQLLAALLHPDAPNDVAPAAYNLADPEPPPPRTPLPPPVGRTGFR